MTQREIEHIRRCAIRPKRGRKPNPTRRVKQLVGW